MDQDRKKNGDYLWDRSGEPDPEVERLERLLSPFRHQPNVVSLDRRRRRARGWIAAGAAVAIAAAAALALILTRPRDGKRVATGCADPAGASWIVKTLVGAPRCDGEPLGTSGRLGVGAWLDTDGASEAEVEVADIGQVRVAPKSRVRLIETGPKQHRLELRLGAIHADVTAPPKLFVVDTPSATAIDLGCSYDLRVDGSGNGELEVGSGWVALQDGDRESIVPAGARCLTRAGRGPGVPWFVDTDPRLVAALAELDANPDRIDAVDRAIDAARVRDTLSLWHLIPRVDGAARARVIDRILALVPALPAGVTRDAVLAGDRDALAKWRKKLMPTWGIPPSDSPTK